MIVLSLILFAYAMSLTLWKFYITVKRLESAYCKINHLENILYTIDPEYHMSTHTTKCDNEY